MSEPTTNGAVDQKTDLSEICPPYIDPFKSRWDAITPEIIADAYTKQHWPLCFSNLEVHCQPGDALSYWEANVILAVIEEIMTSTLRNGATMGTFIIDGYKSGYACECLMRGNLKDGPSAGYLLPFDSEQPSDVLAETAVDDALAYPDKEGSVFAQHTFLPEEDECIRNGIHEAGPLHVMALDVSAGHFLASFYADFNITSRREINVMLVSIAKTLAHLNPNDKVLQDSVAYVTDYYTGTVEGFMSRSAVYKVEQMFRECEHPVIQAWKIWRDATPAANFFENIDP